MWLEGECSSGTAFAEVEAAWSARDTTMDSVSDPLTRKYCHRHERYVQDKGTSIFLNYPTLTAAM